MRHPPRHIFEQTPEALAAWCRERQWPSFRADQVLDWVFRRGVIDPQAMTNLSRLERSTLEDNWVFLSGRTLTSRLATDGTRKLLIEWDDAPSPLPAPSAPTQETPQSRTLPQLAPGAGPSRQTECVMIPALDPTGARRTACISSQVGCPVGCRFCASGLEGLDGNLSAGRIVEQVWRLEQLIRLEHAQPDLPPPRITNVVFMGMGEPLSNFNAVTHAVRILAAPWGMGISARKITISTVGLPKYIERLADELDIPVTLALSLHAPTDEIRRQLIPWAEYTTIADLLAACRRWFEKTGREITLEYTLLRGINDHPDHAARLAALARQIRANVNLIRYNEVSGLPFRRPQTDDVREFQRILRARGINAHIRASRGRDIAAACGQLRREHADASPPSLP
ncbi:MAG: 23S rRNA (adenine(2503)-C(2))-methyltransferase RlmN [Phycisphaeraceae bacterium]|nr:23S rRNA (adenine(2503)-C(2))-methyltransferase RlmN [Phycisphaeraceae bacterium]